MLYLLPNLLNEDLPHFLFLPVSVDQAVFKLDGLIAESEKGGRHFLRRFAFPEGKTFRDIPIRLLNEHTQDKEVEELAQMIAKHPNQKWGVVSDCGLPCLADPGPTLVMRLRQLNVHLETFPGPSSIVMSLVLSGLPGNAFAFHGYLPKQEPILIKWIQDLERRSLQENATQICIEAPYRSRKLLEQLLGTLNSSTLLCCAWDLTAPSQKVITLPVWKWKEAPLPDLDKKPTVFLFLSI